jgi:hypothetical protein
MKTGTILDNKKAVKSLFVLLKRKTNDVPDSVPFTHGDSDSFPQKCQKNDLHNGVAGRLLI